MLGVQPSELDYKQQADLWLEIPKLGVEASIVGVPKVSGEWDVRWLGDMAGWLESTAFPTWEGNTVITAHVWDVFDTPGVFADLKSMAFGDQFSIHFGDSEYIYEVRENYVVYADDRSVFDHSETDIVTLMTCEGYSKTMDGYLYRRIVSTVLVDIRP